MYIDNLLALSSVGISVPCPVTEMLPHLSRWGGCGEELARLLATRNGFYAFESSLLVRPWLSTSAPLGLREWNSPSLWKEAYRVDLSQLLFFAEDVFGCQYCLGDGAVLQFEPETAELESVAASLEEWAECVTSDYSYYTGYPLAHEWQILNHPLQPGYRLRPKLPFVLGGQFEVGNLYESPEVDGMIFLANIANQLQDVADGEEVTIKIV